MKNPLTPAGMEPATFRFVAQHLNHCATAVPLKLPILQKENFTENIQQLHKTNTVVLNLEVMPRCVIMQQMSQDHPFIMMCMRNYNEYELDISLNKY